MLAAVAMLATAAVFSFDPAFPGSILAPDAAAAGEQRPQPEKFVQGFCSCYGPTMNCFRPDAVPPDFWIPGDAPPGSLKRYGPLPPHPAPP